jgi:hypothetical protein
MIAALAGAGTVLMACLLARELGGRRFAQALAGLAVLAGPVFLLTGGMLSVSSFEPLFWSGCSLLALRLARGHHPPGLWLLFGLLGGLGVEFKYTMGLTLVCLLAAMACTGARRALRTPFLAAGAACAGLVLLPTLAWQVRNHWPLLTDLATIRATGKNVVFGPWAMICQQALMLNPLLAPIWVPGLVRLLRRPDTRFLGLFYLFMLAAMMGLHGKSYYLAAIYPLLFAAGAVAIEEGLGDRARPWPQTALAAFTALQAALFAPALLPLLPPARLLAWQHRLGIIPAKTETRHSGPLMQPLGDQFGWPELARETASVYFAQAPTDRPGTGILCGNYGEAGAIDQFGPSLGLPPAICAHNAYSFWGPPATAPRTLICLGFQRSWLERQFREVRTMGFHHHPWAMAEEEGAIYLCRDPDARLRQLWPGLTRWD